MEGNSTLHITPSTYVVVQMGKLGILTDITIDSVAQCKRRLLTVEGA